MLGSSIYPWSASGQLIWNLASMPPFTDTLLWHRAHIANDGLVVVQCVVQSCAPEAGGYLLALLSIHNSEVLFLQKNQQSVNGLDYC